MVVSKMNSLASISTVNRIVKGETLLYQCDFTPRIPISLAANLLSRILSRNLSAVILSFRCLLSSPTSPRPEASCLEQNHAYTFQRCKHTQGNEYQHLRDFLVKLWAAERKAEKSRLRAQRKITRHRKQQNVDPDVTQPPPSQTLTGFLQPSTPFEIRLSSLLARSNLLITRKIEWANLVMGFEQENRYAMVDVCYPEFPVGYIKEQSHVIYRQLLRNRRPFVASIVDANGNELFTVRRPFWWITSSIYAEADGQEIGVVHRRWHLWRRVYDLYLGNRQFAVVENAGFWHWTFDLKDIDGNVLAQINRDWRGFGYEIFTDAGQYVIRFGGSDPNSKTGLSEMVEDLEISRPLTLSERAVAVALAISLDNDYFSRHGGWGIPFIAVGE